ncbi:MAG: cell division protein FtsA [Candidatus Nealsonbacteria bacterium]|nr:cell division protein FtsA [Candidatus Nealsonbacteria bacterium]
MAKSKIITGLDIGSHSIKTLAVARKNGSQDLEFLGAVEIPSLGIRKGVVFDVEKVSNSVTEALGRLQQDIGRKIEDVYVNIGGSHIFSAPSRGTVIVSRADRRISEEDVNRVVQAAQAFPMPLNNEILEVFPKEFIVDGQGQIKEPRDMQGLKLEAEVLALCGFLPYKKNLAAAVLNANFQVLDVIPSCLASSRAVLTSQQKELGVCLLDIGAGTTDFMIYQEGDLSYAAVFPVGSSHITNDLAVGFKIDVELAEQIKKQFGTCLAKSGNKKEKVETENNETLIFSHKMLVNIINARVCEIFDLAQKELKKICPQGMLPGGVVLTGGGAKLPRIVELAKKELKLPARIGLPQGLEGLEKDPALSTVYGLVLSGGEDSGGEQRVIQRLSKGGIFKKIFKVFIP